MFTLSNLIKRGANYLFMVLLARSISLSLMGEFSSYLNILTSLLLISNFGFSEFLLVNSHDKVERKSNVSFFIQSSIFIVASLVFFSLPLDFLDRTMLILVILKIYFETSLYNILLAYYQVENKIKVMTISNVISGCMVMIVSFISYYYSQSIYIYLLGINFVYLVIFSVLLIKVKLVIRPLTKVYNYLRPLFSQLKYYGITTITIPVYMMLPTVIGSFILPKTILAQYQIAFSIANILLLISVSLLQVGYTSFVNFQNDFIQLTKALKKTAFQIISINFLIFVFFLLFGKQILLVVYQKNEYLQAFYPLLLLLFGNVIFMVASISAVGMVVLKLQKEKAKFHLEFIIVSLIFGFSLTYFYGIYGVVSSYLILYSYSSFKYLKKYIEVYRSNIS